jgi:branched-chain amino acid transport system substrate-binding protein
MNRRGIDLAVEEINAAWRERGKTLRVVQVDDSGSGRVAARVAQGFVDDPNILAVIGHVNSGAMVSAAKVYDGRLTAVSTTASSPELSGISPWVFRVISSDSTNGIDLARFASQTLGHQRAAILYENNSYGRGLTDAFRRSFAGEVVSYDPVSETGTNLGPHIEYLRRSAPGIVFVATTDVTGIAFLREAKRQGLAAAFLGGDGWTGIVVDTVASEGAYVGAPFSPSDTSSEVRRFVQNFITKYRLVPDHNAALAYDATKLLATAADQAGGSRKSIRDWVARLDSATAYRGITGRIRFQPNGDPVGNGFVMTRVRNGAMVLVGSP